MFVVDTNVLVYAANTDCPEHAPCRELLLRFRKATTPWFLTWGIVYEFLRVTTHSRVFRQPLTTQQAWSFIGAVVAARSLRLLTEGERHAPLVEQLVATVPELRGNLWHDAHTVALMREHGIPRIYTRDTDFHRFPGIEVLDPLNV